MELRVLRYFLTVARERSITGAANFLHMTQPTLSRQLKELEEELGQKLFVRSSHHVNLTEAGLLFRKRAEEILDMVDKTTNEFSSFDDITSGDVYIGSAETDAFKHIAEVANNLKTQYPNFCYHLTSGNSDDVTELLDRGLIDFGIVVEPVDLSKYDFIALPNKDIWGVLMRKDSPLAAKSTIQIGDLLDKPLIVGRQPVKRTLSRNAFTEWFGAHLEQLNIVTTYNLTFNATLMVRAGLGYSITFDNIAYTGQESDLCFRPLDPVVDSGLIIIWKKYQVFSPASALFLKNIRNYFKQS